MKKGAKICLVIALLSVIGNLATVIQTQYQIVSPIIPGETIWLIIKPFILMAIATTILTIAGLIFYFYDKYLVTIVVCSIAVLGQQLFHYW
ncbi:MAG TPA: hypothetical protein VGD35_19880 [Chitinophaga sp.]